MKHEDKCDYIVLQHPVTGKYFLEGWRSAMYGTREIMWVDQFSHGTKFNSDSVFLNSKDYSFKFPWDKDNFEQLIPKLIPVKIRVTTVTEVVSA